MKTKNIVNKIVKSVPKKHRWKVYVLVMIILLAEILYLSFNNRNINFGNSQEKYIKATVIEVIDGDTIKVKIGNKEEKIRMVLVNTPETKHPTKGVEYYGKEASAYTKKELTNKEVYLEKDVSDRDKYGRLLRYIWLEIPNLNNKIDQELKEKCFNAKLLLDGYANLSTFPPDVKYVEQFKDFEKEAKKSGVGLWKK